MRLAEWMGRERYTDAAFMAKINELLRRDGYDEYNWRAVAPWRNGVCIPRPQVVAAIAEFTDGAVAYADHVAENAPHRRRGKVRL